MNWLIGDSGVRFAFAENANGGFMAASSVNENGPGGNSGADRDSGSFPESGDSGGSDGGTGPKGQQVRRTNRSRKRHDDSRKAKSL